jgi:hypothetical protein
VFRFTFEHAVKNRTAGLTGEQDLRFSGWGITSPNQSFVLPAEKKAKRQVTPGKPFHKTCTPSDH